VITHKARQRRARPGEFLGQGIHLAIQFVADDESGLGVEHRQTPTHVVERDVQAAVERLELIFLLKRRECASERRKACRFPTGDLVRLG